MILVPFALGAAGAVGATGAGKATGTDGATGTDVATGAAICDQALPTEVFEYQLPAVFSWMILPPRTSSRTTFLVVASTVPLTAI